MVIEAATARWMVMSSGDEEGSTVVLASFLPSQVGRRWKWFREALIGPVGVVDFWTPRLLLVHDAGVLELLDERLLAPELAQK